MNASPFMWGYADGLHDRGEHPDEFDAEQREKYETGYRIGVEDRRAGALEPIERLS